MKVVLPISNGEVTLHRDENQYLRPAMGKGEPGNIAEHLFGLHGFTDCIGAAQLGGENIEFFTMDVKQELPSTKKSDVEAVKVPLNEIYDAIKGHKVSLNIFLNIGVRMYYDKLA